MMKKGKAEFYRLRRIIRHIKSLEDEEEKNRRLANLRRELENMRNEALKGKRIKILTSLANNL